MSTDEAVPVSLSYRGADGRRHVVELPPDVELDITHPAVQRAADRVTDIRQAKAATARAEERAVKDIAKAARPHQPARGRYKAITTGAYRRRVRPQASADDRRYVPGALRHWRIVHGLSLRAAQARIGYSQTSCSWSHWESGTIAPPYATLLRILAASGMRYTGESDNRQSLDPNLRLDADRAQWAAGQRARRARRRKSPTPTQG
jgi:transcriptional regulator with XRE-family HTH domain